MLCERNGDALVAKATQIALVKLPMSRKNAYVIALLSATAAANCMMYSGAAGCVSICTLSSHARALAWYHEAGHGGPEEAPDATSNGPCADTQLLRRSRWRIRTMLAHRVSA
jgi:hypothetical protein